MFEYEMNKYTFVVVDAVDGIGCADQMASFLQCWRRIYQVPSEMSCNVFETIFSVHITIINPSSVKDKLRNYNVHVMRISILDVRNVEGPPLLSS